MSDVTRILSQIESGDPLAAEQLLPLVYHELRQLAAARLAWEKPGQTLQATALVHEAFLRLVDTKQVKSWDSRGHFFAAAAEAMRRILVDLAKHKGSLKRGRGQARVDLNDQISLTPDRDQCDLVLQVNEALTALEAENPRQAQLVKLRYFAGMSLEEAAQALGVSLATAKRDWTYARVWLFRRLQ
jgi:RNA polymerase sigma factor (TIGR02999 family)